MRWLVLSNCGDGARGGRLTAQITSTEHWLVVSFRMLINSWLSVSNVGYVVSTTSFKLLDHFPSVMLISFIASVYVIYDATKLKETYALDLCAKLNEQVVELQSLFTYTDPQDR